MRFSLAFITTACFLTCGIPAAAALSQASCDDQAILSAANYAQPGSEHWQALITDGPGRFHREAIGTAPEGPRRIRAIAADGAGGAYVLTDEPVIEVLRREAGGNYRVAGTIGGANTGLQRTTSSPSSIAARGDQVCVINGEPRVTCFSTKRFGDVAPERVIPGAEFFGRESQIAFLHDGTLVVAWRLRPALLFYDVKAHGHATPSWRIAGDATDLASPSAIDAGPDDRLYVQDREGVLVYASHARENAAPQERLAEHFLAPRGLRTFTVDANNRLYAGTQQGEAGEVRTFAMQPPVAGALASHTLLSVSRTPWPIDSLTSDGLGGFIADEARGQRGDFPAHFTSAANGELIRLGPADGLPDAVPATFANLPNGHLASFSKSGAVMDLEVLHDGTFRMHELMFEGYPGPLYGQEVFASSSEIGAFLTGIENVGDGIVVLDYDQHLSGMILGPHTQFARPTELAVDRNGTIVVVNATSNEVTVYDAAKRGDAAPVRTIGVDDPARHRLRGLLVGPNGTVFVASESIAPLEGFSGASPAPLASYSIDIRPANPAPSAPPGWNVHLVYHCRAAK